MSIKDGIRNLFGLDEGESLEMGYTEETSNQQTNRPIQSTTSKVIPIGQRQAVQKANIHVLTPRVYSEAQDIATFLLRDEAVLVNFRRMDAGEALKIIDFLSGAVYALKGNMQQVSEEIFLCSPANINITNLDTEEQRDEYYY